MNPVHNNYSFFFQVRKQMLSVLNNPLSLHFVLALRSQTKQNSQPNTNYTTQIPKLTGDITSSPNKPRLYSQNSEILTNRQRNERMCYPQYYHFTLCGDKVWFRPDPCQGYIDNKGKSRCSWARETVHEQYDFCADCRAKKAQEDRDAFRRQHPQKYGY